MGIADVTKLIKTGGNIADDLTESGEERQKVLSERHVTDMQSDSWLSKNIRPVTLIFLMVCQLLIIVSEMLGATVSDAIIIQVGTLLFGAFSFYFYSRQTEKVASKNAAANIKLEEIRTRHKIKMERKAKRNENRSRVN